MDLECTFLKKYDRIKFWKILSIRGVFIVHEGHRKRLRDKFEKYGLDVFNDHEVLELLLFWAIPRKDTNVIAHKLMEKCGSFSAVLDAPVNLLTSVNDVGKCCALFLKLIPQISRRYQEDKFLTNKKVPTLDDCFSKLVLKFLGRTSEAVAIMLFDAKGKIVYDGVISEGSVNAVEIYSRKIIELISLYFATSMIIAHNHPSGIAIPSKEDINTTNSLYLTLKSMRVTLIDHIIVADDDYVSMRDCKFGIAFEENKN